MRVWLLQLVVLYEINDAFGKSIFSIEAWVILTLEVSPIEAGKEIIHRGFESAIESLDEFISGTARLPIH